MATIDDLKAAVEQVHTDNEATVTAMVQLHEQLAALQAAKDDGTAAELEALVTDLHATHERIVNSIAPGVRPALDTQNPTASAAVTGAVSAPLPEPGQPGSPEAIGSAAGAGVTNSETHPAGTTVTGEAQPTLPVSARGTATETPIAGAQGDAGARSAPAQSAGPGAPTSPGAGAPATAPATGPGTPSAPSTAPAPGTARP